MLHFKLPGPVGLVTPRLPLQRWAQGPGGPAVRRLPRARAGRGGPGPSAIGPPGRDYDPRAGLATAGPRPRPPGRFKLPRSVFRR